MLSLLVLAAAYFLISPRADQTYPGTIPWRETSLLRPVIDALALGGLLETMRGVEIKTVALHLAAVIALLAVGLCQCAGRGAQHAGRIAWTVRYAQVLLAGWVLLSLLSSLWSDAPSFARGQAALYALQFAWAVALAHLFERRHLLSFLVGTAAIAAGAGLLCAWYYFERNPFHRPGFPLGNPSLLAAAMLPGALAAAALVARTVHAALLKHRPLPLRSGVFALVALLPILGCLSLTFSRGALLALTVGLLLMVLYLLGRRLRWMLGSAFVVGLLIAGGTWFYVSQHDVTMARGASLRFRIYAWRYAAQFWQTRPFEGHGAGAYPRVAGQLAVSDRALDPAAFMAEIVEHAHNEVFEVLTEIGLVGGVTYVGGLLATFVAAAALIRRTRDPAERWLLLAMVTGFAALLVDAMVGVAPRLPGGGAVFFTMLGVLWGTCRSTPRESPAPAPPVAHRPGAHGILTALVCLLAAIGAAWLTAQNFAGLQYERAALAHEQQGSLDAALQAAHAAETRLLDPVRKVAARRAALRYRASLAQQAALALSQAPDATAAEQRWHRAVTAAERTYAAALRLREKVPALTHSDATAAWAAEVLRELHRQRDPQTATQWHRLAELSWRNQQRRTPYDVATLLALTRYPATTATHIGQLCDALRFGAVDADWLGALQRIAQKPDFAQRLSDFVAMAGPITDETDVDTLVASRAPEIYRLVAAWRAMDSEYRAAAAYAAHAAELYVPLQARFPTLRAKALREQADYLLHASPEHAPRAAALLRQALDALPPIQTQQYDELARPYREDLVACLLVAGELDEAIALAAAALGEDDPDPAQVEQVLQRQLHAAALAGVPNERLWEIAGELCPRFPTFCEP